MLNVASLWPVGKVELRRRSHVLDGSVQNVWLEASKSGFHTFIAYLHKGRKSLFCHTLDFCQIFQLQNRKKVNCIRGGKQVCVCVCIYIYIHVVVRAAWWNMIHVRFIYFLLPTFVKWPWISLQPRMSYAFLSPICWRPFSSLRQPAFKICRIFSLDCSKTDVSSWDSQEFSLIFSLPSGGW